jgi:hypothetical protein
MHNHHRSSEIALSSLLNIASPQSISSGWVETISIGTNLYHAVLERSIVSPSLAGFDKSTMSSQPTKGRSVKIRYLQRTR